MRALAAALALAWPGVSDAACRLALVLALDVSGSVDALEYGLQMNGVASALGDAEVQAALFAMPDAPVALSVFEWSSASYQRIVQDWVLLETPADVDAVRARLTNWPRARAPEATGLGAALSYGKARLEDAPRCWSETLDISADGKNNDWPMPERLRAAGDLGDMTVNVLMVAPNYLVSYDRSGVGIAQMASYFEDKIIYGPGAFVEIARGYGDYADAMRRKLIRELTIMPLGQAPARAPYRQAAASPLP